MPRTGRALAGAASLLVVLAQPALAERVIGSYGGLTAVAPDGFSCARGVTIVVRAGDRSAFEGDRLELQRLVGLLRAALGFECPGASSLTILGMVGGQEVYRGSASEGGDWVLAERPTPDAADRPAGALEAPLSRAEIAELQRLLNVAGAEIGFAAGPPDGIPGRRTLSAIAAYERTHGLPVQGRTTRDILAHARSTVLDRGPSDTDIAATPAPNEGLRESVGAPPQPARDADARESGGDGTTADAAPPPIPRPDTTEGGIAATGPEPDRQAPPTALARGAGEMSGADSPAEDANRREADRPSDGAETEVAATPPQTRDAPNIGPPPTADAPGGDRPDVRKMSPIREGPGRQPTPQRGVADAGVTTSPGLDRAPTQSAEPSTTTVEDESEAPEIALRDEAPEPIPAPATLAAPPPMAPIPARLQAPLTEEADGVADRKHVEVARPPEAPVPPPTPEAGAVTLPPTPGEVPEPPAPAAVAGSIAREGAPFSLGTESVRRTLRPARPGAGTAGASDAGRLAVDAPPSPPEASPEAVPGEDEPALVLDRVEPGGDAAPIVVAAAPPPELSPPRLEGSPPQAPPVAEAEPLVERPQQSDAESDPGRPREPVEDTIAGLPPAETMEVRPRGTRAPDPAGERTPERSRAAPRTAQPEGGVPRDAESIAPSHESERERPAQPEADSATAEETRKADGPALHRDTSGAEASAVSPPASAFDILGISAGMTLEEARKALAQHFAEEEIVFDGEAATLFAENGSCLYHGPSDPKISSEVGSLCLAVVFDKAGGTAGAIGRIFLRMVLAGDALQDARAAFLADYGEPRYDEMVATPGGTRRVMGWGGILPFERAQIGRDGRLDVPATVLESEVWQAEGVTLILLSLDDAGFHERSIARHEAEAPRRNEKRGALGDGTVTTGSSRGMR